MKLIFKFMIGALCIFSSTQGYCVDSPFVTVSDFEERIVQSGNGESFIKINDAWHPINALHVDDNGYCYLQAGYRGKKYRSASDSEAACILGCSDCGRVQTCRLVVKNKGRCSACRHIFPANAFSWKCSKCKTQNYFNPERCGLPTCRCLREICDPDF